MRVFLDANVLFSAARSNGAVRELLRVAIEEGHVLVADTYVVAEAARNTVLKSPPRALEDVRLLLSVVEVAPMHVPPSFAPELLGWLPDKDRPVLEAAIAHRCDLLVTGDKRHFGSGYGREFAGVRVCSPAMLAVLISAAPT